MAGGSQVCHPECNEGSYFFLRGREVLRGVYPELNNEILRFAQNDKRRIRNNTRKEVNNHQREGKYDALFYRSSFCRVIFPSPGV